MAKDKETDKRAQEIIAILKATRPYLFSIDKVVSEIEDGLIKLDIRVYKGFVTDVLVHKTKRLKFETPK